MSLKQIVEKIKGFYQKYVKTVIWVWITILILINSYILGYLSDYNQKGDEILKIEFDPDIQITKEDLFKKVVKSENSSEIYASKNGTKYYFSWCGSSRIKEENKIYFQNEDQAREEGYEISTGCAK